MGIFYGLAAAFGWGTGDFLVRGTTRRVGSFLSLLYMQGFGLIFVLLYVLVSGELARLASVEVSVLLTLALSAVISVFGTLMLYQAFAVGMLSIVSPIASSYAAVTLILSLLSGERLTALRAVGVIAALIGVVLTSIEHNAHGERGAWRHGWRLPPGVALAIGCAVVYGVVFWMQGFFVIPHAGAAITVFGTRVVALAVLFTMLFAQRRSGRLPDRRTAAILFGVGVLDTAAFIASSLGAVTEQVSIVTVLSSMFSAWTVLLAWLFLRERPHRLQWLGIGFILTGIVLVSLGGG